jgi:hypothetical protein
MNSVKKRIAAVAQEGDSECGTALSQSQVKIYKAEIS